MIDVIIPVYNTPLNDLERCLNSILNQIFTNYKVYIIDDGSNDKTKKYLDNYVKDKDNFIVKHINNNGVSNARNIGIDISNSKYITFIDADDTVEENFLQESYEIIENNNLDIIIGGYKEIKESKIIKERLCLPGLHIYNDNNRDLFFQKLLTSKTNDTNKELGNCPTGRIYTRLFKRNSISNLRFNSKIKMSEDTLFMVDYMYNKPIIGVIDKIWYNYHINEYSISNNTKKEKMINNINDFIIEIEKRMNKENDNILKESYKSRINKSLKYIDEIKNTDN